ncbi:hypothetical protein L596_020395 [Steinernema carpocapsae]|uniref:Uncharacterized protein n=2 Tax=Steinernema carpocapsae TaxID=34508 RepID=A0A4U5MTE6_STECR|nr:hypothetical protein L596_020395 [Steinernema carpocapsae]
MIPTPPNGITSLIHVSFSNATEPSRRVRLSSSSSEARNKKDKAKKNKRNAKRQRGCRQQCCSPLKNIELATMPSRRTRGRQKSAHYSKSIDFPTVVMQVARRASSIRIDASSTSASPTNDSDQAQQPKAQLKRKSATVIEPDQAVFSLPLVTVKVSTPKTSVDGTPTSSTDSSYNTYSNSPGRRRRVVDVSDHKTCALLMTKMKESNRSGSPLSESQLVF